MKFSRQRLGWSKSLWLLQRVAFIDRIDAATFEVNTTNHKSQKSFNDNWRCYPWFYAPLHNQTLLHHKYMGEKYIYIYIYFKYKKCDYQIPCSYIISLNIISHLISLTNSKKIWKLVPINFYRLLMYWTNTATVETNNNWRPKDWLELKLCPEL